MIPRTLTILDWLAVLAYFAVILVLGLRFRGRQGTSARYFLGTRQLPGWAVGMSMFATIISSWAFLALPGKAWLADLRYLMVISLLPIAAWLAAWWVIPLFRTRIQLSAYEYLEHRFGRGARIYGNLAFLIVHFGKMAAILYLLCLAVASMTGWNLFVLIAIVGATTLLYTYAGGIEGVVWADVAQGLLLLVAGVLAAGFLLFGAPGGPGAVLSSAWDAGKFRLVSTEFAWDQAGTWVLMIFGLNYYLQKYVADQTVVQRYLLSPSDRQAARALWLSSGCVMLVWGLFMSIGVLLWSFYQQQPELLPAEVRAKPDGVFPFFIGQQLPSGLSGLMLAGLLAATMSTLSSDLNSLSAVIFDDYYRKLRPDATDAQHLRFSRLVVLVAGLLGIVLAMAMTRIHSMADAAFDFVSLVGGGVLGMYLLGFLTRRASARGLYVGVAVAILLILWAHFCGPDQPGVTWLPRFPLHSLWIGLLGNVVVFGVGYFASLALKRTPATTSASTALSSTHD